MSVNPRPQRDWVPFVCEDKETGEEVLIKSKYFDEKRWKFIKEVPHKDAPKESPAVAEPKKEEPKEDAPKVITPEQRFAFLKSKGWNKLDGGERKNYKELKEQLAKPRIDIPPAK